MIPTYVYCENENVFNILMRFIEEKTTIRWASGISPTKGLFYSFNSSNNPITIVLHGNSMRYDRGYKNNSISFNEFVEAIMKGV